MRQDQPQRVGLPAQVIDQFEVILVTLPALPNDLQDEWKDDIAKQLKRSSYLRRVIVDADWYLAELREPASTIERAAQRATEDGRTGTDHSVPRSG